VKLDLSASWGYPVMRPAIDDYVECEFQSSLDPKLSADMSKLELCFEVSLSVPELKSLVDIGKARVVIYTFCRDTWFSSQIEASAWKGKAELDAQLIDGELQIWTLVLAKGETKGFTSKKFHPEYGDCSFDVVDNQILAIAQPEAIYVSRDVFKNVSSLFDYDINHNLSEGEWRVLLDENRLVIAASAEQIKYLRNGENTSAGKAALLNGIFLPALTQAVAALLTNPNEYEDLNWAKVLQARMHLLQEKNDSLVISQQLLQHPLGWLNKQMKWMDDGA
jgi:hypothetical protein